MTTYGYWPASDFLKPGVGVIAEFLGCFNADHVRDLTCVIPTYGGLPTL